MEGWILDWAATEVRVLCCLTSLETVRTIRDEEPITSISSFTQLLSSVNNEFNVAFRPQRPGVQDAHSSFTQLSVKKKRKEKKKKSSILHYVHKDRTDD